MTAKNPAISGDNLGFAMASQVIPVVWSADRKSINRSRESRGYRVLLLDLYRPPLHKAVVADLDAT